jgi:hypothetical protein
MRKEAREEHLRALKFVVSPALSPLGCLVRYDNTRTIPAGATCC